MCLSFFEKQLPLNEQSQVTHHFQNIVQQYADISHNRLLLIEELPQRQMQLPVSSLCFDNVTDIDTNYTETKREVGVSITFAGMHNLKMSLSNCLILAKGMSNFMFSTLYLHEYVIHTYLCSSALR